MSRKRHITFLEDSSEEYNSSDEEILLEEETCNFAPSVKNPETVKDLIIIGEEWKEFSSRKRKKIKNDYSRIASILSELKAIDEMVGLKTLKKAIVEQIIFFVQELQGDELMHTVLYGFPGVGKCCAKDTPIIMYDGSIKKVQEIQVGEQLMGDDNEPRNVLSLASGREMMYEIEQEQGNNYIVNESHILTVKNTQGQVVDIPLKEAIGGEYRTVRAVLKFENKRVTVEPYLLGLWLGFLPFEEFIVILEEEYGERFFCFYEKIQALNLQNGIPLEFKTNSVTVRALFLKGFLNKNEVKNIPKINKTIMEDINFITNSLGYYLDTSEQFIKLKKFEETPIKIKKLQEDQYYGFVLDGNSRFLLSDTTVTHNTTMGKILGGIYKKLGILSKGNFYCVKRNDFIGKYLGHTADKTQKLLDKCKGSVMFLDEAYSLGSMKEDSDSFSKEAIDTLNQFLSENNKDFICIIAGYEDDLNNCFFSKNAGLSRRFPWKFRMDKYNSSELYEIFIYQIEHENWQHEWDSKEIIGMFEANKELFVDNGGDCKILLDKCKIAHAKRIFGDENKKSFVLTKEDFVNGMSVFLISKQKKTEPEGPFGMYV